MEPGGAEDCSICMELVLRETGGVTSCGHAFCLDCIHEHLQHDAAAHADADADGGARCPPCPTLPLLLNPDPNPTPTPHPTRHPEQARAARCAAPR